MTEIPEVVSSRTVYSGPVFDVRTDEVRYHDGKTHAVDIVDHRGSYAIIATTSDDRVVLVQQYRHAVRRVLWEIPAGRSEEDDARSGALRELQEETGYRAASIRLLGSMLMTPGFCNEILHVFHASGLTEGEQKLDPDERITVASFTLEEAQSLVETGQIGDAKTLIGLMWLGGPRGELVPRNGR
jgi:ADP-ribose pyrophosphatase